MSLLGSHFGLAILGLLLAMELVIWGISEIGVTRYWWPWRLDGWLRCHWWLLRHLAALPGLVRRRRRGSGTALGRRQRTPGLATGRELRALTERGLLASAAVTRPSLNGRKDAWAQDYGVLLGVDRNTRQRLWAALRDVVLVIAPPQTGKTAWLGGRLIDAPGALVATSTKSDLYEHTARIRRGGGRPVWVFNPERIGGVPHDLRWSPLEGCTDPTIAQERAGYFVAGANAGHGMTDAGFWEQSTVRLLRNLLYAAAVAELSMRELATWVNDPADRTPVRILEEHEATPTGWTWDLRQIMDSGADRTRASVYLTLGMALQFMTDPAAAEAVCPIAGERVFSMDRFLKERGTVYLIGSDRPHSSVAALFAALTGYVFEGAKRAAQSMPGGRLDPPLLLGLDEAALICPVPLDRWTADSGGRGIPLLICVQSPSQLYERWGERAGQTIFNNANATMVFGGLSLAGDLEQLSKICGDREERVHTHSAGARGRRTGMSVTKRTVPVLSPAAIRQLPDGHALLLYRSLPPVIVGTERVWERADVRAAAQRPAAADSRATSPTATVVALPKRSSEATEQAAG